MKKQHKYLFVLLFSFLIGALQAQSKPTPKKELEFKPSYHHSSGFSLFVNQYTILPVASYWGRVNLLESSENLSFSASVPASLGLSLGTYGSFFAMDIPLTMEVNIGNQATEDTDFPIGAFIGGGYGFNAILASGGVLRSYGPLTHVGIRATSPFTGRSVGVRVSYLYGIGGIDANGIDYNSDVFGIGAFYSF